MRAIVLLGDLLAAAGRCDEARDVWESLLELDPGGVSGPVPSLKEVEDTMPRR